jgi:selenocysteine lyase/cysteine desulfurase
MITTWEQRARREGIVVKQISFPVPPPSAADVVERFRRAMTPKTRVIEVTHITNLTGQILPVKEIVRMARERNVEVFVDGAHAFAHFPFRRDDLECDYYGTSLHKWLLAPIGTGFLYVRKAKQKKIWPLMAGPLSMDDDVRKYDRRVKVLTPLNDTDSCGIGLLHVEGVDTPKLQAHLWDKHRIMTTPIVHAEFNGLRVTPNVYTTMSELDLFSEKIEEVLRKGLPAI